jgi:hypothetical protein
VVEQKYEQVRTILKQLPELNYNMLEHLMDFLDTMTRDADDNLMTAANLAICFGPCLMRRLEDDITLILKDTPFINEIITSLIEQYGFYFRVSNQHYTYFFFFQQYPHEKLVFFSREKNLIKVEVHL